MKAFEVWYHCPGVHGSDTIICKEEDFDKTMEEKTGYKIDKIEIEDKRELSLTKVPIRDLDAQSFLNSIRGDVQ